MPKARYPEKTMSTPIAWPPDILGLLSAEELHRVRAAFREDRMAEIAEGMLVRSCPALDPWATSIIDRFFRPGKTRWEPGRREQLVVALLSASHRGEGAFVAVHIYWALMYLEPTDVVDTLVLCGTYAGFDATHGGIVTLGHVLRTLKTLCASLEPPDVDTVLPALLHH
jgi:hypothetical protein